MASCVYDVFLSHTWVKDVQNRSNHDRVARFNQLCRREGLNTWFDDERMTGHIAEQMCSGIEHSSLFIVFVTQAYAEKVSKAGEDNCKKEFGYAVLRKGTDLMIPVLMEYHMKDQRLWKGRLGMELGSHLYYPLYSDDNFEKDALAIIDVIKAKLPQQQQRNESVRDQPSPNKDLESLSVDETCLLLRYLNLNQYTSCFREHCIDGAALSECEDVSDLQEIGIGIKLQARKVKTAVEKYKVSGVPRECFLVAIDSKGKPVKTPAEQEQLSGTKATTKNLSKPQILKNSEGRAIRLGNDSFRSLGFIGSDKFYCGVKQNIPGTDGRCGPSAGPQCDSCRDFTARYLNDVLTNEEGNLVRVGNDYEFPGYVGSKQFYCGLRKPLRGSDGRCGPSAGPACDACRTFTRAWSRFILNKS